MEHPAGVMMRRRAHKSESNNEKDLNMLVIARNFVTITAGLDPLLYPSFRPDLTRKQNDLIQSMQ